MLLYPSISSFMEPQKTQFLSPQEEMSGESLFKELENELDFGDLAKDKEDLANEKKHPLQIATRVTDILFKVLLVASFILGVDVTLRNLDASGFLSNLPICSYLAWGVGDYDNTECKLYVEIKDKLTKDRAQYEKDLTVPLAILVPKKLQSQNVLNSPEVQFIQLHTAGRVTLTKVLDQFNEIKASSTIRRGEDIECKKLTLDEKGILNVNCDCYGFGLNSGTEESNTSRSTALALIDKLSDKNSHFQIVEVPKALDLEKYSSSDLGIKSTFSTHTTLNLKLRYVVSNKS